MSRYILFCFFSFVLLCNAKSYKIRIVEDGTPVAKIVISSQPTKVAQFAAYELQYHIKKITGAKLPIVKDNEKVKGVKILVGESKYTKKYRINSNRFKNQEYLIRFYPDAIVLIGKDDQDKGEVKYPEKGDFKNYPEYARTWPDIWDQQGTLYATYDFLEKFCGVKWLNPTEFGTFYPEKKTLTVKGYILKRAPFFKYRDVYTGVDYESAICLWKRDSKEYNEYLKNAYPSLPGTSIHYRRPLHKLFFLRMKAGGKKCYANHSLYDYYKRFPPDKYPEIWAKGYQGTPNQLCYTNEKLIELVAKDAENYFKLPEKERRWGKDCFAVVPMDNRAFCKCENCQKLIKAGKDKYKGRYYSTGTYSEYFFNFVNEVAKRVKKTNPDKVIITLAYDGYATYPETIKLEPNIAVMFCFASNRNVCSKGYSHEIELLKEWGEKCKRDKRILELWLYYTFPKEVADNANFHCFPGFFSHKIKEQFDLFKKLNIKGMFHCGYGQEVEAYVTFKLMDNPDLNIDKLLDEYFNCLYGNAAKPMKNLYLLIEKIYTDPKNYPSNCGHQTSEIAWGRLGTKERMDKMKELIDEAKDKAKTEREKTNVKLFEEAIWSYMVAGYNQYQKRLSSPIPEYKVPVVKKADGNLIAVDWNKGTILGPWYERGSNVKAARKMEGVVVHDGKYLYLKLTDWCNTKDLVSSSMVFPADDWEIFIAKQRAMPYRHIAFNPEGLIVVLSNGEINFRRNLPVKEHHIKVISKVEKDKWISKIAIPFSDISLDGLKKGEKIYINIIRVSSRKIAKTGKLGIDTLVPFTTVHELERLAGFELENF